MQRYAKWLVIGLSVLALLVAGCSKEKDKVAALQSEVAQMETKLREAEGKLKERDDQVERAALKAAEEKRQLEETLKAFQIRVMHDPLDAFRIEPGAPLENGWYLIDGERTYTLLGHTGATKVSFFWADGSAGLRPQLLGEDTNGRDGWSWRGTIPFGTAKAFWAEVHYPGGVKLNSPVLPVRNAGK